ncbi:MAG: serine hydrolase [Stenomitos frigidus ULC029]
MRQLLKAKPATMQRQNLELRAKLARAERLITQLRAEASQLRAQIAEWQRSPVPPQTDRRLKAVPRSRAARQRGLSASKTTQSTWFQTPLVQRQSRRHLMTEPRSPFLRQLLRRRSGIALLAIIGLAVAVLSIQPSRQPTAARVESPSQPSPTVVAPKPPTIAELVYNVPQPPPLESSEALQAIVDGATALAASKGLPTEPLSITLIDLKTNQIAGYQNQTPRYPASVVKLFWLVACEAQLEQGLLPPDAGLSSDLTAMIVHSDNDAASRIFDRITQTTSGTALSGVEYETWLKRRLQLNRFFQAAGYDGLSISQKNYPIYSLQLEAPGGRELQMRDEQQQPIRSLTTTDQAARLMHELTAGKAVSASRSQAMMTLLTRDLQPETWKKQPNNAIAGFLGAALPADVRFASKVGMTTKARHEVAFVESKDGKVSYILAVFGTDETYSQNAEILPAISNAVFTQMMESTQANGV